jgi:Transglutaminase-like superfamily
VRSHEGGGYLLVAGLHRFEAAKKLKWKTHRKFGYEHAAPMRGAIEALAQGRGVCRDFAHLAVMRLERLRSIPRAFPLRRALADIAGDLHERCFQFCGIDAVRCHHLLHQGVRQHLGESGL